MRKCEDNCVVKVTIKPNCHLSILNQSKKTHHHPLAFRPELPPPLPINAAIPKAKNGCGTSQKAAFEFLQINIP